MGNTSLWGQYSTPTPFGWIPDTATPMPTQAPTEVVVIPSTATDTPLPTATATSLANFVTSQAVVLPTLEDTPVVAGDDSILYYAQGGDWLPAVANRFGVSEDAITSPRVLPDKGFVDAGTLLIIPDVLDRSSDVEFTSSTQLMPDAEVVFSATSAGFDINNYIRDAGGYLASYREYLGSTAWTTGAQEITRLSFENSLNPRLILAILDYEAQWVRGTPESTFLKEYPLRHENYLNKGLFGQMGWAVNQIYAGYYGWRLGTLTELTFSDGKSIRLDPTLNAGTVAVMTMFSRHHTLNEWLRIMDVNSGFPDFYAKMFGDPWSRADAIGNFFPPGLSQPNMTLPIEPGSTWSFTGGPHGAWESEGPRAAIDFAPQNGTPGCFVSDKWVTALASGLVVRSGNGVVVLDLDGDGSEQTGWNILYLHIASKDRVAKGEWVEQGGQIGHASCEGGVSTGTHVHIARKYNGEWLHADGPVPFVLGGWTVIASNKNYEGKLVRDNKVVTSDVYGQAWSLITREDDE